MALFGPLLMQLLPVLIGLAAPLITELIKNGFSAIGKKLPPTTVPIVNSLVGAIAAGLSSASPAAVVSGVAGAKIGQNIADIIRPPSYVVTAVATPKPPDTTPTVTVTPAPTP